MNAASDRLSDGDLPIALDPLQLEPGDEHEDSDREPAHRCRAVELSSTETNRAFASVSRRIEVSASTAERATCPGAQQRSHPSHRARSGQAPAGTSAAQALRPTGRSRPTTERSRPMQLRPSLDLLPLHPGEMNDSLTTGAPADPNVAVRRLYSAHVPRRSTRCSQAFRRVPN